MVFLKRSLFFYAASGTSMLFQTCFASDMSDADFAKKLGSLLNDRSIGEIVRAAKVRSLLGDREETEPKTDSCQRRGITDATNEQLVNGLKQNTVNY